MFSEPHKPPRNHSNRVCQLGLALLELASALSRRLSKQSVMLLDFLELPRALLSEFGLALLELASALHRRLSKQSVMFLEPRDVGRPDESVFAQEGNPCYQSSYQLMHSAIGKVRDTISCGKPK